MKYSRAISLDQWLKMTDVSRTISMPIIRVCYLTEMVTEMSVIYKQVTRLTTREVLIRFLSQIFQEYNFSL
jgi:hypothetical protein